MELRITLQLIVVLIFGDNEDVRKNDEKVEEVNVVNLEELESVLSLYCREIVLLLDLDSPTLRKLTCICLRNLF